MGRAPYKSAKEDVGTLSSVSAFTTMKEHPCPVHSNSMCLKQIIGQTATYNGATSSFEGKF